MTRGALYFLQAQDGCFISQQASDSWYILLQEVDVAGDQVAISLPKTTVNERSQITATANFRTRSTAEAATPTTVHYKVSNLQTKETVQEWTSVSAASQVTITLTGEMNKIRDNTHVHEKMELLVSADKGLSTEFIGRATYRIRNVYGRRD